MNVESSTFLALSSFLLLICRQTPSLAAIAVAANAAEPAPGRMVPGLVLAVPGRDKALGMAPVVALESALPARFDAAVRAYTHDEQTGPTGSDHAFPMLSAAAANCLRNEAISSVA